jgi:type IV secretion system protein VirB10
MNAEPDITTLHQPEDINSVGSHRGSVPIKKVAFVVALVFVLIAVALGGARWYLSKNKVKDAATALENKPPASDPIANVNRDFGLGAGGRGKSDPNKTAEDATAQSGKPAAVPAAKQNNGVPAIVPKAGAVNAASNDGSGTTTRSYDRYAGDISLNVSTQPNGVAGGNLASLSRAAGLNMSPTSPVPSVDAIKAALERLQGGSTAAPAAGGSLLGQAGVAAPAGVQNAQGAVAPLLRSTTTPRVMAVKSIDENLVIPKGWLIDCSLRTRIVTEVSGFASCQVNRPVYSANGRTLLIERFSEVEGEYVATAQAGQRSIYVVWSRIRKPGGITIDIDSPATDGLGTAGLPGYVDNRWFERIGSAYMLSLFKDVVAYEIAKSTVSAGGGSTAGTIVGAGVLSNSINTSNSLAEKVLQAGINIKATIYKNQGDRATIYVARDLDFSSVYDVRKQP